MNPFKLLNPAYLFDPMAGSSFLYFWPLLVFCILMFIASFWSKKIGSAYALSGVPARMREIALLGLLFTFFRDQGIPYLGMRIWLIALLVGAVIYGFERTLVAQKEERFKDKMKEAEKEDRYLPRPKKTKKT